MADPILWPLALRPSSAAFFLEHNSALNVSPLNRATQAIERQGARWRCDLGFEDRGPATAALLDATLALLRGGAREVLLWDHRRPRPRGTGAIGGAAELALFTDGTKFTDTKRWIGFVPLGGAKVRAAAAKGADTVVVHGWSPYTAALLAGDYIGLGGALYMVVRDATADGLGTAFVSIEPRLRAPVPAGATVTLERPTARFRLVDNMQGQNRTVPYFRSSYPNIQFVESL